MDMLLVFLVVFGYFAVTAWLLTKLMESENPRRSNMASPNPVDINDLAKHVADQEARMAVMTAALVALCDGKINGADGVAGKAVQLQGGTPLSFQPIPDFR